MFELGVEFGFGDTCAFTSGFGTDNDITADEVISVANGGNAVENDRVGESDDELPCVAVEFAAF